MIRLAVLGELEVPWQAIAARLRGVTLVWTPTGELCDAALVCGAHGADLEPYLQAGKPVLLSADAAHGADPNLPVVNPERYLPSRQLIRQQLDAGKLGDPGMIRVHRWTAAKDDAALLRDLDLVLWYFGKQPNLVFALETIGLNIHLGFPGGGMALINHAHHLPVGERSYYLSLIGSSGAAYADEHQNMQLAYRGGAALAVRADEGVTAWVALVQEFAERVRSGQAAHGPDPAWQSVLRVNDAVQESLRTKQAVAPKGAQ